ncbi:hypothetical protein V6N13_106429 [Hibiscus sabdariffa]|uniref:Uncharacterized protein n=1 Tax=Hibiscus sabdariffa TaxID=183260 RepID=A0ABR2F0M7_9ROSI
MATPQSQETWPLRCHDYAIAHDLEYAFPSSGCGCIAGLRWWRRKSIGYINMTQAEGVRVRPESWLKRKARKLREISEILAGPRWKNFSPRFITSGIDKKRMQFQYDPRSYQLNFDHREAGTAGFPDFSARFAAPAAILKATGGRDKQTCFDLTV